MAGLPKSLLKLAIITSLAVCIAHAAQGDVPTPTWPPSATRPAQPARLSAMMVAESGHHWLRSSLPLQRGWHLTLLSVDFFKGAEFLGTYQRFEEQTDLDSFGFDVPDPAPADRIVVRLQVFKTDEREAKAMKREGWYSNTWGHFTTATRTAGGWNWFRSTEPLDRNLALWLERSELNAVRTFDATAEAAGR